jgi:hypothetical protein
MDLRDLASLVLGISAAPTAGYLIKRLVDLDKDFQAHVDKDEERFKDHMRATEGLRADLQADIGDLKTGLRDGNQKLDRLIEHMLDSK